MSDSVDRVFVHALATVRRLPRTGSSRPPPTARLRLYGLYKQSMEGDVSAILPRPFLPPNSPNPNDPNSSNPTVHRYSSRDARTRELQSEIEKWDAWHSCAGMTRTEAKRRYITTLIETMKEYASGTIESRELVSELEFVWNQIKSQSGSEESESGESPTRKLERSGLKRTQSLLSDSPSPRNSPSPPLVTSSPKPAPSKGGGGGGGSLFSRIQNSVSNLSASQLRPHQNLLGLKVLSPISQKSDDDIVENEEIIEDQDENSVNEDEDDDEDDHNENEDDDDNDIEKTQVPNLKSKTIVRQTQTQTKPQTQTPAAQDDPRLQSIESQLRTLTLELTALREQLSSHNLLSRSSFSHPFSSSYYYYPPHYNPAQFLSLPLYRRLLAQLSGWIRWLIWTAIRQIMIQVMLLGVVVLYGRIRGDRRVEGWVRGRIKEVGRWVGRERVWGLLMGRLV